MKPGSKILVTGVTGQVAEPIARALAADNEVWGVARFRDPESTVALAAAGVTCMPFDFHDPDLTSLPSDFDHVLHFGRAGGLEALDFAGHLVGNAEIGGLLLAHCRTAKSFLHCSTTGVYAQSSELLREDHPMGDNFRKLLPTYSISKIAAESVISTAARIFGVPTVIARLNVPYGVHGGMPARQLDLIVEGRPVPLHPEGPGYFTPIHDVDLLRHLPGLLAGASVPATVVNWGGSEVVSVREYCEFMAAELGLTVTFERNEAATPRVACDVARLRELVGEPTTLGWREGMRRMIAERYPALVNAGSQ